MASTDGEQEEDTRNSDNNRNHNNSMTLLHILPTRALRGAGEEEEEGASPSCIARRINKKERIKKKRGVKANVGTEGIHFPSLSCLPNNNNNNNKSGTFDKGTDTIILPPTIQSPKLRCCPDNNNNNTEVSATDRLLRLCQGLLHHHHHHQQQSPLKITTSTSSRSSSVNSRRRGGGGGAGGARPTTTEKKEKEKGEERLALLKCVEYKNSTPEDLSHLDAFSEESECEEMMEVEEKEEKEDDDEEMVCDGGAASTMTDAATQVVMSSSSSSFFLYNNSKEEEEKQEDEEETMMMMRRGSPLHTSGSGSSSGAERRRRRAVGEKEKLLREIREAVEGGAEVMQGNTEHLAFPSLFVMAQLLGPEGLSAGLSTPHPIDFSTTCQYQKRTLFHFLVLCDGVSDRELQQMFRCAIHRLETHPTDVVNWDQRDWCGKGVLHCAAETQRLSLLWPDLLSNVPFFADQTAAISLRECRVVWSWDWQRLGSEEQQNFSLASGQKIIHASEATAQLCRLSWQDAPYAPSAAEVQRCVDRGADVLFRCPSRLSDAWEPLLYTFLCAGHLAAVAACLTTPRTLDLEHTTDDNGRTCLHAIVTPCHSPAVVTAFLSLLLARLQRRRDEMARMNWFATDMWGDDFFTRAAKWGMLSTVWNVFQKHQLCEEVCVAGRLIPIHAPIDFKDWMRLGLEGQLRFEPVKSFK